MAQLPDSRWHPFMSEKPTDEMLHAAQAEDEDKTSLTPCLLVKIVISHFSQNRFSKNNYRTTYYLFITTIMKYQDADVDSRNKRRANRS